MGAEFNWFPGHMNKTLKEIEKKIPIVDLVIEVVDGRAPFSSQNLNFRKVLKNKPVLYAISKSDLADDQVTKQWIEYFVKNNKSYYIIEQNSKSIVKDLIKVIDTATKEKQDKDKAKGFRMSLINVLIIGIPNVGKSTFINKIIKDKNVKVGNKPGVTRGIQSLSLNEKITLMDTPGVLPSRLNNEFIATNLCAIYSIKEEVYPKERVASNLMRYIYKNYPKLVQDKYKISDFNKDLNDEKNMFELFAQISNNLGWDFSDGTPNIERVMQAFIRDLANGKFGKVSFETPNSILEYGEENENN